MSQKYHFQKIIIFNTLKKIQKKRKPMKKGMENNLKYYIMKYIWKILDFQIKKIQQNLNIL